MALLFTTCAVLLLIFAQLCGVLVLLDYLDATYVTRKEAAAAAAVTCTSECPLAHWTSETVPRVPQGAPE